MVPLTLPLIKTNNLNKTIVIKEKIVNLLRDQIDLEYGVEYKADRSSRHKLTSHHIQVLKQSLLLFCLVKEAVTSLTES